MLSRVTIGQKLVFSYAVALAAAAAIGAAAWLGLQRLQGATDVILSQYAPSNVALLRFENGTLAIGAALERLANRQATDEERARAYADIDDGARLVADAREAWEALPHTDSGWREWKAMDPPGGPGSTTSW
ncbi:hypothetical protein [Anaeromyxobacter diazotrophicus]|uniref:Uncharacterized protein n=1 Tax=Anaeromyxobacter diazotrophicus TaxID=2590199 RepID=A0A7I9VGH5_9BACT|nr:hypothetical protein [Anaeromyxobacter diazotrophicus]GEJ55491.1 hypothetical protein AMYX_02320 [Anaeromyxobacter diazotrophicus]